MAEIKMNQYKRILENFNMMASSVDILSETHSGKILKVTTSGSDQYIIKLYKEGQENHVQAEAQGLRALAEASHEFNGPRVPILFDTSDDALLMEFIPTRPAQNIDFKRAGELLGNLHKHKSTIFGLEYGDNFLGPNTQINNCSEDWGDFFFENRLMFQANLTSEEKFIDSLILKEEKIKDLLNCEHPEPSILHGDLWSGNLLFDEEGKGVLIDPAIYFGDREAELAMTYLFGGFLPEFYEGYRSIFKKRKSEDKRKSIYILYHLLNHYNIYGSSYKADIIHSLDEIKRL